MLEDPEIDHGALAAALRAAWAIESTDFTFVPGLDMTAAAYRVGTTAEPVFLKVRLGAASTIPLEVPRALLDAGVPNILAPLPTVAGGLWHTLDDDRTLAVYPFAAGRTALEVGMDADQWRTFGQTLRLVHDIGIADTFADRLPTEAFDLPSALVLERMVDLADRPPIRSPTSRRMAALLHRQASVIDAMLARARELGAQLAKRTFVDVLCHADIHAANILVAGDGRIYLVDWDGPMLAPRERDLLFVIGSRVAGTVTPEEQASFFAGYGDVAVDHDALVYYRYERIIEDIGEFAKSVMTDAAIPAASCEEQLRYAASNFGPGGMLESAEW